MSDERLPVISIDQADAVELVELFELVESWLAQAAPAVAVDFARFVGPEHGHYPLAELRAELIGWAARLALAPGEPR
ncbi:MAG: hypothetical protein M0Z62_12315 [Actinomycetota bacterium]|nr:hypothetical protein [Actinomycetota bacterium]MDA8367721.1 hypothetical protein [Actinomycetota bacterium]